ncbi:MAG: HlyD family secretion protein [Phycisphaerae bacterium]
MKKKRIIIVLAAAIVLVNAVIAWYALGGGGKTGSIIRVSGNFEVTAVDVSFRIPGWVKERPVDEGWEVHAGKTLIARLDDVELREQEAQTEADLANARSVLAELNAGSRPEEKASAQAAEDRAAAALAELKNGSRPEEIAAAEAAVQAAKVEVDRTKLDYDRLARLRELGASGAQEYDNARSAYQSAAAKLEEARQRYTLVKIGPRKEQIDQATAALKDARERNKLVQEGPRQETKDQAAAKVRQLTGALALARTRLGFCTLLAPVSGVVLSKNTEAGEYVAAGTPIVTVGDLRNIWLRAYINETDLERVKLGQRVKVTTDAYPHTRYEGRISFIASQAEFTPKNVQTAKERVKLVYRIKITVPNEDLALKPGMPADAEIDTSSPADLSPVTTSSPAAREK